MYQISSPSSHCNNIYHQRFRGPGDDHQAMMVSHHHTHEGAAVQHENYESSQLHRGVDSPSLVSDQHKYFSIGIDVDDDAEKKKKKGSCYEIIQEEESATATATATATPPPPINISYDERDQQHHQEEDHHHQQHQLFEIHRIRATTSSYFYFDDDNDDDKKQNSGEIVEVGEEEEAAEVGSALFSLDFDRSSSASGNDTVYVAVSSSSSSSSSSSMDALSWTLNHAVVDPSSTTVFLVHVFPEIKHIPTPLGMMPMSQVNPEQKQMYMHQERDKRRDFLNTFLNACSSAKVKVDTILIESDMEAKVILDLISILNVTKLVLGTTKTNLRKMMRSSRRSTAPAGMVDQILKGAPEFCNIKIICEGKEVLDLIRSNNAGDTPTPSPRANYNHADLPADSDHNPEQVNSTAATDSFRCRCFKPKVML